MENGYTFSRSWLEAYRRADGNKVWTAEFKQRSDPYHRSAKVGPRLVFEDGSEWMMIDTRSGEIRRRPVERFGEPLGPSGLKEKNGNLTYIISGMNMKDFNRSPQTIYSVTISDFVIVSKTTVEVIEAGEVEWAGDFFITDALYRTACFRRDGTKVWEHFQMHRTPVVGGVIYFSDYKDKMARLGSIEVATGKETIFLTEPVAE